MLSSVHSGIAEAKEFNGIIVWGVEAEMNENRVSQRGDYEVDANALGWRSSGVAAEVWVILHTNLLAPVDCGAPNRTIRASYTS
jgi:hypothetical protein